jgi:hypothetical protein
LLTPISIPTYSLLAFPGSSHKVSGEIENEFSKYSVRMLDASLTCVIDICSAVIAQHNKAGNFAGYDVLSLWKRSKAYQDRVLGLYYDVLSHFYQDTISSLGLPATAKSSSQTTRYGNNKMLGDVGNLGNITVSRRELNTFWTYLCSLIDATTDASTNRWEIAIDIIRKDTIGTVQSRVASIGFFESKW